MVEATNPRTLVQPGSDCPTDEQLGQLVDETISCEAQAALVGHLDRCRGCRRRLENAAGSTKLWTAVTRSLRQPLPASSPELQRVTATMLSSQCDTITERRPAGRLETEDGTPAFNFLTPCDNPDRLGRLGRYEVIELLGQGGMGFVFKADDSSLSRLVALKVLLTPLVQDEKARERLRREARAAASVHSEHVVAIHVVEDTAPMPYLVMELVEGTSLHDLLRQAARPSWEEIARIGAEIADGLEAAHATGLVHRDVKPSNILLERGSGRVKITDFGLARTINDAGLTQTGCIVGTPEFMAPEQAEGTSCDHRADLFSLGSVLYEMCTGNPPFCAETTLAVLRRTKEDAPTPINRTRPDVPAGLLPVIERLLEKDPANRFGSAAEVAEALRAINLSTAAGPEQRGGRVEARQRSSKRIRVGWVAVAASLLLAVTFAASELCGFSNVVAMAAAALGEAAPEDESPDKDAAAAAAAPAEDTAPAVQQPTRMQIVTPDGLMRESIRLEKDQVPEAISPHLVRKFEGHTGPVADLAFSPDGKLALSGGGWPQGDRTLRLWEVASGKEIRQFDMTGIPLNPDQSGGREAPGEVYCLEFMPDGKQAVAGISGGAVGLWDVSTGKLIRHFEGHTGTVYGLSVSKEGDRILTGGRDSTARLWNFTSGEELLRIESSAAHVRSVAFSPDGKRALLGGWDHKMRLWDLDAAQQLAETKLADCGRSVAFSPDGGRAVSTAGDSVCVWDVDESDAFRQLLELKHPGGATCVAFSPDGMRLLTGGYDMTVRLWNADDGELIETYEGHRGWVFGVAFSPDGSFALSGGGGRYTANRGTNAGIDFALRLWKLPKKETRVVKPK